MGLRRFPLKLVSVGLAPIVAPERGVLRSGHLVEVDTRELGLERTQVANLEPLKGLLCLYSIFEPRLQVGNAYLTFSTSVGTSPEAV